MIYLITISVIVFFIVAFFVIVRPKDFFSMGTVSSEESGLSSDKVKIINDIYNEIHCEDVICHLDFYPEGKGVLMISHMDKIPLRRIVSVTIFDNSDFFEVRSSEGAMEISLKDTEPLKIFLRSKIKMANPVVV